MKQLFYLIAFILLINMNAFAQTTISMTGEKWAPYNNYAVDKEQPGFMFEIVQIIFQEHGISVSYEEVPWARAIMHTRFGRTNALIGPAKTDAPDLIFPTEPIGFTKNVFYVKADTNWKFDGIKSLSSIRLGVLKNMTYGEELDRYIAENRKNNRRIIITHGLGYLAKNFFLLDNQRIDATIDDFMVINYFFKQNNNAHKFKAAGTIGQGYGIYLAFSPKYPNAKEMCMLIDNGVAKLRKSGRLKKILAKYGAVDWK